MLKSKKKKIFFVLMILNCIVIFYFSNQVADNSSKQSGRVVEIISKIIPSINNMQEPDRTIIKEHIITPIVRKMAHFSIYTMLGIITMNYMNTIENKQQRQKGMYAFVFCALYAITDEIHQYFIPGRSAEIRDVWIDSSGAIMGILLTVAVQSITRKRKNKERKQVGEN